MKDMWSDVKRAIEFNNPDFRALKAYTVNSDGSALPIEGENIYIEIENERGLLIPLQERRDNEGISIRSFPAEEMYFDSLKPDGKGSLISAPFKSSSIVIRNGGANLVYISPETRESQLIEVDPNFQGDS